MLSEGIYDEQSRKQGLWKYYFVTGELKEQGAYKNDKKTGTWKFFFINGDVEQIGEYVQDLPEGTWRWYYANKQVRLEEEYIGDFSVPFVKESTIQIGLQLKESLSVASNGTTILIGEVVLIRLNETYILEDGTVELEAAGSITVAGLDSYHRTEKIGRLAYAKPHVEAKKI